MVVGGAGVGKTRLAEECLRVLERCRATIRVKATRATADLPFGAIAPLLPPGAGAGGDRAELLRRAAEHMIASLEIPPIVFVDDAHLLDELSATLIYQLATTRSASVLLTVRAGEPVAEPLVALWKEDVIQRVELAGLRIEAIGELLAAVLN